MGWAERNMTPRIGSLFSGYGGLDTAVSSVLGGDVAWHVEVDKAASRILAHHWPSTPNLGDITAVDWATVDAVDALTGGFPCQDVSHAGKRLGIRPDTRSGLWSHFAYAIDQMRPRLVVVENVRGLLSAKTDASEEVVRVGPRGGRKVGHTNRALGRVLGDLAELGYDARWAGVRAADAGAPHGRFRVFIVAADTARDGWHERWAEPARVDRGHDAAECVREAAADAAHVGHERGRGARDWRAGPENGGKPIADVGENAWGAYAAAIQRWEHTLGRPAPAPTETGVKGQPRLSPRFVEWMMGLPEGHVTDVPGISRNDQLKALGNGVVPQQAELALRWLLHGEWAGIVSEGEMLPTPEASDGSGGRVSSEVGGVRPSGSKRAVTLATRVSHSLLPTPAVNDMGAGKTVKDWDAWTDRMKTKHGNGNGHGKSLAIEAQRIAT